jgi:hypothetical protein
VKSEEVQTKKTMRCCQKLFSRHEGKKDQKTKKKTLQKTNHKKHFQTKNQKLKNHKKTKK